MAINDVIACAQPGFAIPCRCDQRGPFCDAFLASCLLPSVEAQDVLISDAVPVPTASGCQRLQLGFRDPRFPSVPVAITKSCARPPRSGIAHHHHRRRHIRIH